MPTKSNNRHMNESLALQGLDCSDCAIVLEHNLGHMNGVLSVQVNYAHQVMHIELFPHGIIHAECLGGEIDLLVNQRVPIGFFPWRFVDGESSIGRCVAFVDDDKYEELMAKKAGMPKTRFGDAFDPDHVGRLNQLSLANMA